jgi:hypothetical protein
MAKDALHQYDVGLIFQAVGRPAGRDCVYFPRGGQDIDMRLFLERNTHALC